MRLTHLSKALAAMLVMAIASMVPLPGAVSTAPPPPPVCTPDAQTFTNSTPVAITSASAVVVTSTIAVSGMSPWIADVDVVTDIKHTFSSDLDITVTSPAGTSVTLTTDNGGSFDNVFAGTTWDDSANPGGAVPYTSNPGVVTDHVYTNLAVATPLVPEESLAAFIGEDPNGNWTLTVSDDASLDGGSIDSWSLVITAYEAAPITDVVVVPETTPLAIPTGPAVVSDSIGIAASGTVLEVGIITKLKHTNNADIDMTLTSPAGTVVTLTTDNGGSFDNVFDGTLWSDHADPGTPVPYTSNAGLATDRLYANLVVAPTLVPEESFGAFIGEDPNGAWTITISDDLSLNGGSLDSWEIKVVTAIACPDIVAPSVAITEPVEGVTYLRGVPVTTGQPFALIVTGGTFEIKADATDNFAVASVDFYADSTLVCTDTSAPYTCSWTAGGAGPYTLTAHATDPSGNVGVSAPVDVVIV